MGHAEKLESNKELDSVVSFRFQFPVQKYAFINIIILQLLSNSENTLAVVSRDQAELKKINRNCKIDLKNFE